MWEHVGFPKAEVMIIKHYTYFRTLYRIVKHFMSLQKLNHPSLFLNGLEHRLATELPFNQNSFFSESWHVPQAKSFIWQVVRHPSLYRDSETQCKNLAVSKEPTEKLYSNAQLCHVQLIHLFFFSSPSHLFANPVFLLVFPFCNRSGENGLITKTKQVQKNWLHQQVHGAEVTATTSSLCSPWLPPLTSAQPCGRQGAEIPGCWQKREISSKRVGNL